MNFKSVLWLLPFICFSGGYFATRSLFHRPYMETPSLVGKNLFEAFTLLSNNNLSPRLLDQKIDPDLPEGTVINQNPSAGKPIKQRQTVFLVLSKKPPITPAPSLVGKSLSEIEKMSSASYKIKTYPVPSCYPTNQCISQYPHPNEPIKNNLVIAYVAQSTERPFIWPNFVGRLVSEVVEFLKIYNIEPHIISSQEKSADSNLRVIDQRPYAGSLVSLNPSKLPYAQLNVQ
jgi:beta-lactam-binding protein with PASTA domain